MGKIYNIDVKHAAENAREAEKIMKQRQPINILFQQHFCFPMENSFLFLLRLVFFLRKLRSFWCLRHQVLVFIECLLYTKYILHLIPPSSVQHHHHWTDEDIDAQKMRVLI